MLGILEILGYKSVTELQPMIQVWHLELRITNQPTITVRMALPLPSQLDTSS